jgi:hypothetical protein
VGRRPPQTFSISSICAPSGAATQHMPTVVDALFEDLRAVLLKIREGAGVIVGLDRDVPDADMLLMILIGDDGRHVELHAVQVELAAAAGNFPTPSTAPAQPSLRVPAQPAAVPVTEAGVLRAVVRSGLAAPGRRPLRSVRCHLAANCRAGQRARSGRLLRDCAAFGHRRQR